MLEPLSLEVELVLTGDQETTVAKTCTLEFSGQKISLHFKKEGTLDQFYVNDLDVLKLQEKYIAHQGADLLPRLVAENRTREYDPLLRSSEKLLQAAREELESYFHGKTSPHRQMEIISELGIGSDEVMLENIRTAQQNQTWKQRIFYTHNAGISERPQYRYSKCDSIASIHTK